MNDVNEVLGNTYVHSGVSWIIYDPFTFRRIPCITDDSLLGIDIGSEISFESFYLLNEN